MSWRVESKIRVDIRYQHRDSTQILDCKKIKINLKNT